MLYRYINMIIFAHFRYLSDILAFFSFHKYYTTNSDPRKAFETVIHRLQMKIHIEKEEGR